MDAIEDTTLVATFLRLWNSLSPERREAELKLAHELQAKNDIEEQGLFVFIQTFREAEMQAIPLGA